MSSSWRTLILRIGEKSPEYGGVIDFKDHIDACFGAVRRELDHSHDDILTFLLQCSEQLPHKIPLYGTLIGLLNLEDEDFVKKVLENTQSSLQDALDSGDCNKIRVTMRFLTVLMCSKVIQPSSLVVIFETLLSSAATIVDDEKGNPSWQARADFYITCILSCLPWGGAELVEQIPEEIERVMVGIEAYLSIRRRVSDVGLSVFEDINKSNKLLVEQDFVEDLWSRIQDLAKNSWKLESVPRPHLLYEAQLVAGKSHDFGPIVCQEQPDNPVELSRINFGRQRHEAELKYPQRIRRLNVFSASKIEDLQPIDRFVVEEYLLDVLFYLNGCRKECAACMVGLPVPFRYEYLMAETIFSQLLLLPQPPFKPIYYTLVIIDLCKSLPGAFPAVVAGAVRALFDRISELDMDCRTRLILWFSHHLSNFQFIWPWEEWAYVLDLPKWAPQRVFVQEVLDREVRLSYWDKVKQSIESTPALEELLPPKGGPDFRYISDDGDKTEYTLSKELNSMVKGRKTAREIIIWLEETVIPVNGLDVCLRVVVQTLLDIGSKSFTHLITVLERYGQVIAKICPNEETQIMLISEVSSFWKNSAQTTAITIDRMMGYRLISNLAIVKWVFSPSNIDLFHTTDRLWEILRNALNKTHNRISDLRKEMANLKKSVVKAEKIAAMAKAELDGAESKLMLVDNEPVVGEHPAKMKRLISNAEKTKADEVSARESLESKEALFARALEENEALFLSLYKNFSNVLMERLHETFGEKTLDHKDGDSEAMAVDEDDTSAMETDKENGNSKRNSGYIIGEKEQWCLSTLGYVKAFSRQYASEIWPHMDKLEEEVVTESVHPLFRKAVYSGLRLQVDQ
ncbi:putative nuclear cap-binding protein subunit 1 [Helianthus anomalus]